MQSDKACDLASLPHSSATFMSKLSHSDLINTEQCWFVGASMYVGLGFKVLWRIFSFRSSQVAKGFAFFWCRDEESA